MAQKNPRHYTGKDIEMLTKASVIFQVGSEHQLELFDFDETYTTEFFNEIKETIQNALTNIVGVDHAATMRQNTAALKVLQKKALESLAIVHTQIKARYATDKARQNELLTLLGFNLYFAKAKKGDQEALIQLLFRFNTYTPGTPSLTPPAPESLRAELIAKKIPGARLSLLANLAGEMQIANTAQEDSKGDRKELTTEMVAELNRIYDEVILLCKIGQKVFRDNPSVRERFAYYKVKTTNDTTTEDGEEKTPSIKKAKTPETSESPETPETDPSAEPS